MSKVSNSKSKTSKSWLKEHFADSYVKQAKADGYRSRASYKLLEIQKKDKIIKPGMIVVDLGSAPGGWSQVVAPIVKPKGIIIASDILMMDAIKGVDFVQGDFTEEDCFEQILKLVDGKAVDLVISDMAPNISGMSEIDQPRAMHLIDLAVDFAAQTLKPGGDLLMKVFQGQGFDELLRELRKNYSTVVNRKPDSSRSRSREVFVLAKGYKG